MTTTERLEYLEEQVAMLTDMLAESDFRRRIAECEMWIEEWERSCQEFEDSVAVEFYPEEVIFRDKSKDN